MNGLYVSTAAVNPDSAVEVLVPADLGPDSTGVAPAGSMVDTTCCRAPLRPLAWSTMPVPEAIGACRRAAGWYQPHDAHLAADPGGDVDDADRLAGAARSSRSALHDHHGRYRPTKTQLSRQGRPCGTHRLVDLAAPQSAKWSAASWRSLCAEHTVDVGFLLDWVVGGSYREF
jgi:hypothetical protein